MLVETPVCKHDVVENEGVLHELSVDLVCLIFGGNEREAAAKHPVVDHGDVGRKCNEVGRLGIKLAD